MFLALILACARHGPPAGSTALSACHADTEGVRTWADFQARAGQRASVLGELQESAALEVSERQGWLVMPDGTHLTPTMEPRTPGVRDQNGG